MIHPDKIRNIGMVSHGGAGKTTLVEAMLYNGRIIDRLGRVDAGNAFTDFDQDEIERKISINAAIAGCEWNGTKINIIDMPGYMDFIGEVIRGLRVVDSAIILVDATSGIEVGTEQAWKYANDFNLSRLVCLNKIEKENINYEQIINDAKEILAKEVVPIQVPIGDAADFKGVVDLIKMEAIFDKDGKVTKGEIPSELASKVESYRESLIEAIAETDDALTEKYIEDGELTQEEILNGFKDAVLQGKLFPLVFVSAYNNIGVSALMDAIVDYLPSVSSKTPIRGKDPDSKDEIERLPQVDQPFSAYIFKVFADPYVGELTLCRVYSGKFKSGQEVYNPIKNSTERVSHLSYLNGKQRKEIEEAGPGDIVALVKFKGASTGETITDPDHPIIYDSPELPPPIISTAIRAKTKADQDKMGTGLNKLCEEDLTFKFKIDPEFGQTIIYGMGEIHLDIMINRLTRKFNAHVEIEKPKIAYRETIRKPVKAEGKFKRQTGGRGQYGHTFIEIIPLKRGEGFIFEEKIFGGAIPAKYFPAVEKGIRDTMAKGILANYPITDVKAVLYDGSFHEVDSSDIAFQLAASIAFKNAFEKADPFMLEPIMEVRIVVPEEYMGDVIGDLNSRRGKVQGMEPEKKYQIIKALVPEAEMYKYSNTLRSITQGRGTFTMKFSHYEEMPFQIASQIIEQAKREKEGEK
jgi:elongation factor G